MNLKSKPHGRLGILFLCILLVTIVILPLYIWKTHQSSFIDGRPVENLIFHSVSSDGLHSLDLYYNDGKGATIADSTVIIISSIDNGDKWYGKEKWCLYYAYRYSDVTAEWMDNRSIIIHHSGKDRNEIVLDIYQNEFDQ